MSKCIRCGKLHMLSNDHCETCQPHVRIAELEEALIKLRDCDWVITPHDRMDAVREIARKALEHREIDHE